MRIARLLKSIAKQRDYGSAILLSGIFLIATWLVCLPFVDAVKRIALNRFHLQTGTFLAWSAQQMVPSIYNFENEIFFETDTQSPSPNVIAFASATTVNHFPMRVVTFFDGRYLFFHDGSGGDLIVRSRYQDQELITYWRIENNTDNELRLIQRIPE